MPFDIPTILETKDFFVALGQALFPDQNWGSEFSYHGKRAIFAAGASGQLHFHTSSAQKDLHPLTAGEGKPINDWCAALGVLRKGATPARRAQAGRVRGQAAAEVDPGTQLQHPQTGLLFAIANLTTITIPGVGGVDPDSFYDADIVGVDTGSRTRLDAGEVLVFVGGAPAGIENTVKLQLPLNEGGTDIEPFGSIRARFLATLSETPSGGSQGDFTRWAEESLAVVAKAYTFPNRPSKGTVDIGCFYAARGTARSLSAQDRDSVLAYVKTKAPFHVSGEGGALRILETEADPQVVEILVTPNGIPAFNFDWTGSSTVLTYVAATRTVQFAGGTLPQSLRAGHRIIPIGTVGGSGVTAQDGRQYRIEAITGVDTVVLEEGTTVDLEPTDILYPGGPLVDPIRDALDAHLNGETVYAGRGLTPIPESKAAPTNPAGPSIIGLDILAEGIGPANRKPNGDRFGKWAGGIILANLYRIATYKAGVRNITISSPVADYEPDDYEFPNDDKVPFVIPSVILVRSA